MSDILDQLRGGDCRSIGRSNEVARHVLDDPDLGEPQIARQISSLPLPADVRWGIIHHHGAQNAN